MLKYASNKADALAVGQLYYFTGKLCSRGHIGLRKAKGKGTCVECAKLLQRLRRQDEHADKYREKRRRWRAENPEKAKTMGREKRARDPIGYKLAMIRHQAKRKGLEFNLTRDDITIPDVCPVLGIPIRFGNKPRDPHSPSLDRIDCRYGYVKGNVIIVSNRANALKADASIEEIEAIAMFYRKLLKPKGWKPALLADLC